MHDNRLEDYILMNVRNYPKVPNQHIYKASEVNRLLSSLIFYSSPYLSLSFIGFWIFEL